MSTATQSSTEGRSTAALDKQIIDLGGLISLALALVTVFTAARAQAGVRRRSAERLTRADLAGELVMDGGLLVLTAAVLVATAPIAVEALAHQRIAQAAGALRLIIDVVWALLVALAVWQVSIIRETAGTATKVWKRR